ncbi:RibD family protein [Microbacterium sp. NPDC058021]|uniref:RibD family protein n=1 Tax=Microbacterium sp. NPDC058021 TaxID=3346306 RepID=UPI0036D94B4C
MTAVRRPYVTLSCAMSLDGCLDSTAPHRMAMSNAEDFDRVDQLRADHDAILVGASTVRRDNPRLLVRSAERRAARVASGRPSSPAKVTVTATGDLSPEAAFFTAGDGDKFVYCPRGAADALTRAVGDRATVVALGDAVVAMGDALADLARRGIARLMVEGGGRIHTQFLAQRLADELQLVIAPFFVGEVGAPRFVHPARFPWDEAHRARLLDTRRIGDVVLLRYAMSTRALAEADVGG